jgi:hypothetical protein
VNGLEGGRGTTHSGCARCLTPRRIERVLIAEKDDGGSRLHDAIDDPNNPRLNALEQRAESKHACSTIHTTLSMDERISW